MPALEISAPSAKGGEGDVRHEDGCSVIIVMDPEGVRASILSADGDEIVRSVPPVGSPVSALELPSISFAWIGDDRFAIDMDGWRIEIIESDGGSSVNG